METAGVGTAHVSVSGDVNYASVMTGKCHRSLQTGIDMRCYGGAKRRGPVCPPTAETGNLPVFSAAFSCTSSCCVLDKASLWKD